MKSIIISTLVVFSILASSFQAFGEEWEKTVTLSNGDIILDMSGEWASHMEGYGKWDVLEDTKNVLMIEMEGSSFVGVRKKIDLYHLPDTQMIKGELDKNGIKKIHVIQKGYDPIDAEGQISMNGNKILIDANNYCRITLIRK
jgi:hypothetical protein